MDVKLAFGELLRLNRQMLVKIDGAEYGGVAYCPICRSFDLVGDTCSKIDHKDNCLAVQVCNLINVIDVAQGFVPQKAAPDSLEQTKQGIFPEEAKEGE